MAEGVGAGARGRGGERHRRLGATVAVVASVRLRVLMGLRQWRRTHAMPSSVLLVTAIPDALSCPQVHPSALFEIEDAGQGDGSVVIKVAGTNLYWEHHVVDRVAVLSALAEKPTGNKYRFELVAGGGDTTTYTIKVRGTNNNIGAPNPSGGATSASALKLTTRAGDYAQTFSIQPRSKSPKTRGHCLERETMGYCYTTALGAGATGSNQADDASVRQALGPASWTLEFKTAERVFSFLLFLPSFSFSYLYALVQTHATVCTPACARVCPRVLPVMPTHNGTALPAIEKCY